MLAAARRSGERIVQVGQWQRSGPQYAEALEYVRSGKLGNIRVVKVWAYQGWMKPVPALPDAPAPAGVDYDMWLGPSPKRPFNPNRFHFNFRWFWDYAGGLMTDWGVHEIDIALLAMNASAPKSVMASGGKFAYPDDASETPDTLQAVFEYDGFNMLWEHATGIDGGHYGRRRASPSSATTARCRRSRRLGAAPGDGGREDGIRAVPGGGASRRSTRARQRRSTCTRATSSRRSARATPAILTAASRPAAWPRSTPTWATSRSRSATRSTGTRPGHVRERRGGQRPDRPRVPQRLEAAGQLVGEGLAGL